MQLVIIADGLDSFDRTYRGCNCRSSMRSSNRASTSLTIAGSFGTAGAGTVLS